MLEISPIYFGKNKRVSSEKSYTTNRKNAYKNRNKDIAKTMAALALIGIAGVGLSLYRKNLNVKNINDIKYNCQLITNNSIGSERGKEAVKIYAEGIKNKKLSILEYKLSKGMFKGKSEKVVAHIQNNFKNLRNSATMY